MAMGAYISNKIDRHTLLPLHKNTTPLLLLIRRRDVDNVTRDIDPGIIFVIQLCNYTISRHTLLPSNELYILSSPPEQARLISGSFKLTKKPASSRTINSKSHN